MKPYREGLRAALVSTFVFDIVSKPSMYRSMIYIERPTYHVERVSSSSPWQPCLFNAYTGSYL